MLSIVFIGALFSAILSTVDSNLLAVSSLVSINLLRRFHAQASEKLQLRTARLATVGAGIAALGVAMTGSSIYELNAMTSVLGQGGILVATLFGMKTGFGGGRAALAAIFTCISVNIVTLLILPMRDALAGGMGAGEALSAVLAGDIEPIAGFFLFSVGASLSAYVLFGIFEKRASAVAAETAR
jgi:Na+/proline symporter